MSSSADSGSFLADVDDRVSLDVWEELVGDLESLTQKNGWLKLSLSSGTLIYPAESREAEIIKNSCQPYENSKIRVVRVDKEDQPIMVDWRWI